MIPARQAVQARFSIRAPQGIWPALHLDTATTLPIGVEAYAAYALRAWLARDPWAITTVVSCLPVLILGMGTVLAHMLRADAETTDAPDNGTPA